MVTDIPEYYFRIRGDHLAVAFRVDTANRMRRIDMVRIAQLNLHTREITPINEATLTEADLTAINDWLDERIELERFRAVDDILRTIDHLNRTAYWISTRADELQLDAVTDPLLMAMHDLRTVLIREKSKRLMEDGD